MRSAYGEIEHDAIGRAIWRGGDLLGPADQVAGGTWLVCDRDQLELLRETLMEREQRVTGIDTEYEGVDRTEDPSPIGRARIVCTQFGFDDPDLGWHATQHVQLAQRVFLPNWGIAEEENWLHELRLWFESPAHWKVGSFVFSTELHVFRNHGLILNGIRGCGVRQSQTWRMGKVYEHGLKPFGTEILGYEMRDYDEVFSTPRLKKDGQPYANNQRVEIPLRVAFADPYSPVYASGLDYASLDAKVSAEADQYQRDELDKVPWKGDKTLLDHYDGEWNAYQYVVSGIESAGWPIDTQWFAYQHEKAVAWQAELEETLNQWAGCKVKWSSNPQKQHFLYSSETAEIAGNTITGKGFPVSPVCKQGPTLKWNREAQEEQQKKSTDRVAVEWVRDHVKRKADKEGLGDLLLWTKIDTIRKSFLAPFPKWVDRWGMVHSRIGPNAETNRLTVRMPALQTLPRPGWDPVKREGDPFYVREGLMAQPEVYNRDVAAYMYQWMSAYGGIVTGVNPEVWYDDNFVLISLDYSQLEMRILAHYLVMLFGDRSLADDLAAGDLHAATALRVWGNDPVLKGLTPKQLKDSKEPRVKQFRNRGKIINFSVNYGKTAVGLGADIRDEDGEPIGEQAAEAILHQYFAAYPAILNYHKWAKRYVYQNGYVRTLGGRYRYLPSIRSPYRGTRGEAERAALNTPIQGSAADIIAKAMLRSNTLPIPDLRAQGYFNEALYDCGARLTMQIHDELVWRCPYRNAEEAMRLVKHDMERPFDPEQPGFLGSGLLLPVDGAIGVTYQETK